ncbi:MAG: cation:proton antiporter regulatory subunit [Euryarchaeota archaeon]|nr:cation:proton antiporter regulatory subunit [Euryarchaeota archaeon]
MRVEEAVLPGLGKRVTFRGLRDGNSIAIVILDDGRKEIYLNPDKLDPIVFKLDAEEARIVGQAIVTEWRPKTIIDYISRSFQGGMAMDQFTITHESPIAGMTVMDTNLRSATGASIIALVKAGKTLYNPNPTTVIGPGDVVVLIGDEDQLQRARRIIVGETQKA